MGSEEFIRLQFEEYLLSLLSCMKYHEELDSFNAGELPRRSQSQLQAFNIEGDPALEFNAEFLAQWKSTRNHALFEQLTSDALLFSIVEPRHPCAGGLTIDDIQRRLTQQVSELHLDERVREGRELLNRHLTTGQRKVSAAISSFWADIDAMREAQRKRNEEHSSPRPSVSAEKDENERITNNAPSSTMSSMLSPIVPSSMDLAHTQASMSSVGQKASTYLSSWTTWAGEKRKEWQEKKTTLTPSSSVPATHLGDATTTTTTTANNNNTSIWNVDDSPHEDEEGQPEIKEEEKKKKKKKKQGHDDEFEPIQTTGVISSSFESEQKQDEKADHDGKDSVSDTEFFDTEEDSHQGEQVLSSQSGAS